MVALHFPWAYCFSSHNQTTIPNHTIPNVTQYRHSPRSEHCTILRWHWHPNGHIGCSKVSSSSKAEPSSSFIIIIRLSTSMVLPISGRPRCWKGRVTEGAGRGVTHTSRRRRETRYLYMTLPVVWSSTLLLRIMYCSYMKGKKWL